MACTWGALLQHRYTLFRAYCGDNGCCSWESQAFVKTSRLERLGMARCTLFVWDIDVPSPEFTYVVDLLIE